MAISGFSPSPQRTLQIGTTGIGATLGVWQPAKDPLVSADYWVDASLLVAGDQGPPDTVASVACTIVSKMLTPPDAVQCETDGTMVLVLISGGIAGDSAVFELLLTLASGSMAAYSAILPIRTASATP